MTALRDFKRDWRRWGAIERICAAALAGLCAAGFTTTVLVHAHLV